MDTRIRAFLIAFFAVVVVFGIAWQKGWFTPYHYEAPVVVEPVPVAVATTTEHALIHVTAPVSGATTSDQIEIEGEARGQWYFEATFPVQLRALDNSVITITTASAQGDWMTTDFVPFKARIDLSVDAPDFHGPALLVLMKDNPSGLPENEDSITIPITIQ